MTEWQPRVYKLSASVAYPYWAMAALTDDAGNVHFSLVAQQSYAGEALDHARDFARILNANKMTPREEGTTVTADKLPPGTFMSGADIEAAPRLSQQDAAALLKAHLEAHFGIPVSKKPQGPKR